MTKLNIIKPEYIIKRLHRQELGSQDERGGECKRGRYMLMSKKPEIQSFFPVLSDTEVNSTALITLKPIWKGANHSRQYCPYVYHNSKIALGQANGRNENRIYFPMGLDDRQFFGGDIVVFRRDVRQNTDDGVPTFDYLIDWAKPESSNYETYKKIIDNNVGRSESYYLCREVIPCFEELAKQASGIESIIFPKEVGQRIVNLSNDDSRKDASGSNGADDSTSMLTPADQFLAKQFNSASFHDCVLANYKNVCAITNEVISYGTFNNLEAAHIHPKCHGGFYLPQNGIAMRRDIHWAFDKGMFYIDDDLRVVVAKEITDCYLNRYDGKKIDYVMFAPDIRFLHYHRDHIYRQFLTTGALRPIVS